MMKEPFNASAQYDDLKGTVAADWSDDHSLAKMLEEKSLIMSGEYIVAVESFSHWPESIPDNSDTEVTRLAVNVYLQNTNNSNVQDQPVGSALRRVVLEMTPGEFLRHFKRFNICLSQKGQLDGVEIEYIGDED